MAKRKKLGDIIEIPVKGGFAYAQYVNEIEKYGSLLLVFPEINDIRLSDFSKLYLGEYYYVCFPLTAALNKNIFQVVANEAVPSFATDIPVFKTGFFAKEGGIVEGSWYLWDGKKDWKVGTLTKEMENYPDRGIINDTMLIVRIEKGWRPSKRGW